MAGLIASQLQATTTSGFVHGESLPFVNVYLKGESRGTVTNESGYYAITCVPAGRYALSCSYVGYRTFSKQIDVTDEDLIVDIFLSD